MTNVLPYPPGHNNSPNYQNSHSSTNQQMITPLRSLPLVIAAAKRKPKTLVIDLDETVLHSWSNPVFLFIYEIYTNPQIYNIFRERDIGTYSMILDKGSNETRMWGIHRPHLYEFLRFCYNYFDNILIWSAGTKTYVEEVVRQMFSSAEAVGLPFPKIVWSRERCLNYKGNYHKPISELVYDVNNRFYSSIEILPETTLILDDKAYTFYNNPLNGILIPPFHPGKDNYDKTPTLNQLIDRSDNALIEFIQWLDRPEVRAAEDYSKLDKTHIFG